MLVAAPLGSSAALIGPELCSGEWWRCSRLAPRPTPHPVHPQGAFTHPLTLRECPRVTCKLITRGHYHRLLPFWCPENCLKASGEGGRLPGTAPGRLSGEGQPPCLALALPVWRFSRRTLNRGWAVDTLPGLPCSLAPTVVTWQRARLRAPSTSGACSRGKWRRSFQSSMGKVNPVNPLRS